MLDAWFLANGRCDEGIVPAHQCTEQGTLRNVSSDTQIICENRTIIITEL